MYFDSIETFNEVYNPEEINNRYVIVQCVSNRKYLNTLQRICETVSLGAYIDKNIEILRNI